MKSDLNGKDDFCAETECTLIFLFGLTIKHGFFLVLLVGLDLKPDKHPVLKSTYSGISLVSWLE